MRVSLKRRTIFPSLMFVVAAALVLGGGAVAGHPAGAGGPTNRAAGVDAGAHKLYGVLAGTVASAGANDRLRVIVHLKAQANLSAWPTRDRAGAIRTLHAVADSTQPAVRRFLAQDGMAASIYQSYWIFNGFAVQAPAATIRALAAREDVDYIIQDGVFTLPKEPAATGSPDNAQSNWNIYQVHAPETWALGFDGTGRTLANQDTGVDGAHQALAPRWRGILPGHSPADSWLDPFGLSPNFPTASGEHGTHTMGTIVGYFGDPSGPDEIGQAKGADWIACRIYDTTGKGPFSYMHACFQFMADPDGNPATNDQPDAVGNSWGDTSSDSFPDLEWWPDILAWRAVGVIPVFSNANSGPAPGTVNEPGSYPISIGVGAVDINRTIAGFSSRGPAEDNPPWNDPNNWERTDWNLIKPEVVAPGVNVRSSLPNNSYGNLSGTSMASPHVTGLAGILRQIRPDLSVNEFYNIIIDTADFLPQWGQRPNNNYGWGEINDLSAAIYVRDAGTVSGTVMDGSCAAPVVGASMWVYDNTPGSRAQGVGIRKLVSDMTGNYHTILAAGQYTVTISAPGYYGQTIATSIMSSTTTNLPITLVKMAGGTVEGTVTDGTNPVAGASVAVDGIPNVHTTTDAQGHYTLNNVPDGTFTISAEMCSFTGASANITVTYPNTVTHDFILTSPTSLLSDDFESGNLNNWTVTGGSASTAIWNNSTVRALSGTHAARAGIPGQPTYTGPTDTYMTSASSYDGSSADAVWLSFALYDSAESEYDILRAQVSSDGGTTWTTVYGEASPVHPWQLICLDITRYKSANMKIRFYFHADSSNWNGQVFEGPSVDDVRFTASMAAGAATATPIVAMTPTPGTPIPCTPVTETATPTTAPPSATATQTATTGPAPPPSDTPAASATATAAAQGSATATIAPTCNVSFTDVNASDYFYTPVIYLACHGIISGYGDHTFRPYNFTTRGQMVKIVVGAFQVPVFEPPPGAHTFHDVDQSNPFFVPIEAAAHDSIVSGYACGSSALEPCDNEHRPYFRPNAYVTRGQLTKIVVVAAGWAILNPPTATFADVPNGSPFYPFIETAVCHSIISGYADGTFRPGNNTIRGQIAKIVYGALTTGQAACSAASATPSR